MRKRLNRLVRDSRGATAIEYAMIISLIVLAIVGSLTLFADTTIQMWNDVSDNVVQD